MKKIRTFLFATSVSLLGLTSCSSDDSNSNPDPQPENLLLGKWEMETMDMKLEVDGNALIDEKDVPTKETGIIVEYNFKADNKVEYYMYTPANNQQGAMEKSGTATYQVQGEELVLNISGEQTYAIKLLSKTDLHLNLADEEFDGESTYKLDMTQKFVKM